MSNVCSRSYCREPAYIIVRIAYIQLITGFMQFYGHACQVIIEYVSMLKFAVALY